MNEIKRTKKLLLQGWDPKWRGGTQVEDGSRGHELDVGMIYMVQTGSAKFRQEKLNPKKEQETYKGWSLELGYEEVTELTDEDDRGGKGTERGQDNLVGCP